MTPKEIQRRLHAMMVLLQPQAKPKLEALNENVDLGTDLEFLDLAIKYFIYDREASIREAKEPNQHRQGGSDVE
jgi:hypothetical protein